jgi:hypothetical protein
MSENHLASTVRFSGVVDTRLSQWYKIQGGYQD